MYTLYRDNRFVGAVPFLLGAVTGGATYALFNPYRPRPVYYQNYPMNNGYYMPNQIYYY